jgi:hypothetical protein
MQTLWGNTSLTSPLELDMVIALATRLGREICTSWVKDAEAPARPLWFVRRWWVVEYATNQRSSYSRSTPFSEVQFLFIPTDARERPQAERLSQVGKDYSEMAPRLAEWPRGWPNGRS